MNLLDFAMQMELDGKAYYEKLRAETPIAGLQKIFTILAADEQKHYDALNDLRSGVAREMADSTALEQAKNIFSVMRVEESVAKKLRTKLDAYQLAVKMETNSVRTYEDIAKQEGKTGDPVVVRVVQRILEEEKKHYNTMENIRDYIAAQERMVPWRDVNGIKEYKTEE